MWLSKKIFIFMCNRENYILELSISPCKTKINRRELSTKLTLSMFLNLSPGMRNESSF